MSKVSLKRLLELQKTAHSPIEIYPQSNMFKCRLVTDKTIYYSGLISKKQANKLMEVK